MQNVIMNMLSLGGNVEFFNNFIYKPQSSQLDNELESLRRYQMIGQNNQLTLLGQRVCEMTAVHWSDPLVARMMIWGSIFGCGDVMAVVVAGLPNLRLFPLPFAHEVSQKIRKVTPGFQPQKRSQLNGQLTLSPTSDAMVILGAMKKYVSATDKAAFCDNFLLDQKSAEEVLSTKEMIDKALIEGAERREMSHVCLENIMGSAFLPNVT